MRRIISVVLVAALVGAGVWAYLYTQSGGSAPKYRLARVERGPLTAAVSATGTLNAVVIVQVGSLTADLDDDDRVQGAGGRDGGGEGATLDAGQAVLRGAAAALGVEIRPHSRSHQSRD